MPLSMLFKKNDCIPIEFRSVDCESPFLRIYNSYIKDQAPKYELFYETGGIRIKMAEKNLSRNDIKLSFEIDNERDLRHLFIEVHSRFISQRIPINSNYNIYESEANYNDGVLEINIPKFQISQW